MIRQDSFRRQALEVRANLEIAPPPPAAVSLQFSKSAADRIEEHEHDKPGKIDACQTKVDFRRGRKDAGHGKGCGDRERMDQIDVDHVIEQRNSSESGKQEVKPPRTCSKEASNISAGPSVIIR